MKNDSLMKQFSSGVMKMFWHFIGVVVTQHWEYTKFFYKMVNFMLCESHFNKRSFKNVIINVQKDSPFTML